MGMLDFSSNIADAEAPPPLPVGEYPVQCVAATDGTAKTSGNRTLVLTLNIDRQDFPPDFDAGEGVDHLTFTKHFVARDIPGDRFRIRKLCEAFGVPMSNGIDPNEFVGKTARGKVQHGKDLEGETRAEIGTITKA